MWNLNFCIKSKNLSIPFSTCQVVCLFCLRKSRKRILRQCSGLLSNTDKTTQVVLINLSSVPRNVYCCMCGMSIRIQLCTEPLTLEYYIINFKIHTVPYDSLIWHVMSNQPSDKGSSTRKITELSTNCSRFHPEKIRRFIRWYSDRNWIIGIISKKDLPSEGGVWNDKYSLKIYTDGSVDQMGKNWIL